MFIHNIYIVQHNTILNNLSFVLQNSTVEVVIINIFYAVTDHHKCSKSSCTFTLKQSKNSS